jgi:hypothetical protein
MTFVRAGWREAVHRAAAREGVPLIPDFPSVRVHTDEAAAEAARLLSARAFTIGSHVFFGRGEFRPAEPGGRELLRHELVHVLQSPDVDLRRAASLPVSSPGDAAEREAAGGRTVSHYAPGIRRVLAARNSLAGVLAGLVTAGKIETQDRGGLTYFAPPAFGAATVAEVTAALEEAGLPRAAAMADLLLNPHNAWAFTGERDALRPVGRPLTAAERAEATIVFGSGLDYSSVVVREHRILGGMNIARTLPRSVNFPPGASTRGGFLPWLMHELTHAWQYQHGVGLMTMATTAILCRTPLMSYDYGGEAGLTGGRGLHSFNTEQQGDIARDYYRAMKSGWPTAVFDPYVVEFRTP